MVHPTALILVVALTEPLIGDWSPNLQRLALEGTVRTLTPPLPAVTCTAQSVMLTGKPPSAHGIVGNGWYDRESAEIRFWKQSNHLVRAPKVWELARERDPSVTCAKMFWWYNMYSSAEFSVTPRPRYKADGRKLPDVYADPPELRNTLQRDLGQFPLFRFWGPAADISSSKWIADAALAVHRAKKPSLNLVYLPHLDYALQKFGPESSEARAAVTEIDAVVGDLLDEFRRDGVRVMVCSEYGIDAVTGAVPINQILRREGLLRVREEDGTDLLDPGASRAFAVVDHQVAHVYVKDPSDRGAVASLCGGVAGVERVLTGNEIADAGLAHGRSGDLVLISTKDRWFCHDEWLEESRAPDYARTVEIHRKPGYDPRELFIDPAIRFPKLAVGSRLVRKKLGFRTLMDVIPLDTSLVRGSHGRVNSDSNQRPILIADAGVPGLGGADGGGMPMSGVCGVILSSLFDG